MESCGIYCDMVVLRLCGYAWRLRRLYVGYVSCVWVQTPCVMRKEIDIQRCCDNCSSQTQLTTLHSLTTKQLDTHNQADAQPVRPYVNSHNYLLSNLTQQLCELSFFFFFQAEDGIRDLIVTGV